MYVYNVYIIPSSSSPSYVPDINVYMYVCARVTGTCEPPVNAVSENKTQAFWKYL